MRTEVIDTPGALERIAGPWGALFARLPDAPAFMAPGWLIPWWRVFAPGRLFTVAVWDHDVLAGLAPLYIEHGPDGRRLLPLGIGLSDGLDVLLDPARTAAAPRPAPRRRPGTARPPPAARTPWPVTTRNP